MYPIMVDHLARLLGFGWAMRNPRAVDAAVMSDRYLHCPRSDAAGTENGQPEGLTKAVRQSVIHRSRGR